MRAIHQAAHLLTRAIRRNRYAQSPCEVKRRSTRLNFEPLEDRTVPDADPLFAVGSDCSPMTQLSPVEWKWPWARPPKGRRP